MTTTSQQIVKTCACGRNITMGGWYILPESPGHRPSLHNDNVTEWRTCHCGSTIVRQMTLLTHQLECSIILNDLRHWAVTGSADLAADRAAMIEAVFNA